MQLIPVIDIRGGAVMRAVAGDRAHYRPLATPLATSCAPLDVVAGLLTLYPFEAIYVADLDAIEGEGDNRADILRLLEVFPDLRLMIDAGRRFRDWRGQARVEPIIGSESLTGAEMLSFARGDPHVLLSLDFRDELFLGPEALLSSPELWPKRLIVMTLARVGADAGPDFARFAEIVARAEERSVYAAGGVRGAEDLARLEALGAAGALVASALHDGRLGPSECAGFASRAAQRKREPRGLPS